MVLLKTEVWIISRRKFSTTSYVTYKIKQGFEVCSWVFDGLMIYKKKYIIIEDLPQGCSKAFEDETGYKNHLS